MRLLFLYSYARVLIEEFPWRFGQHYSWIERMLDGDAAMINYLHRNKCQGS